VLEAADREFLGLVASLAVLDAKTVTTFWLTALSSASEDKLAFCADVLSSLLLSHAFDTENSIVELVYVVLSLRVKHQANFLRGILPLVDNLLHTLIRLSGLSLSIDFVAASVAYSDVSRAADFAGDGPKRAWVNGLAVIASAFRGALGGYLPAVFQRFSSDFASADQLLRANAIVFGGAFCQTEAPQFAARLLKIAIGDLSILNTATVVTGLSLLEMDTKLASRLFFAGVCLALLHRGPLMLPLLASAVRQLKTEDSLCADVKPELVDDLGRFTSLDFESDAMFSAIVLVALYADEEDEATLLEFLSGGSADPVAKLLSILFEKLKGPIQFDFGQKGAAVGLILLRLLKLFPKNEIVEYVIGLCQRVPRVFAGLPIFTDGFGIELLTVVQDPRLAARLWENVAGEASGLVVPPALLQTLRKDASQVQLSPEQVRALLTPLFD
jgi:hypothetical protein